MGKRNLKHSNRRVKPTTQDSPEVKELKASCMSQLSGLGLALHRSFERRITKAHSTRALEAIAQDLATALNSIEKRRSSIPVISYPDNLPVSSQRDEIAAAIQENQVVIIAGETGSGKTTQIPKICLDLGRGITGLIGHTQPRRLAARTVAERIADELDQPIGESVGYAIRFDDRVSPSTSIKLMTDGILLAEMQRDRYLNAYDTIIIDEAHERSLNIDFILGYLKQLLPKRPDLKVIITSATIDPERFAHHFSDENGTPAPIIEVSGRTYPVEVLYRPLQLEDGTSLIDVDPIDGLISAIKELMSYGEGDILCFFAGESDIRDAMEAIKEQRWRNVEVTPLFGRLSNQEQHKVFTSHTGRRIVLATNIAETSLTVPGIHFVVDLGTARISRYSSRTKVQRLPIEPISQASARQRSGRCGRVADGIAIRLYSEEDFLSRPEFTDPEILRTNLANVILQMASLRLGHIDDFPFIQAPDTKSIRDGILLLHELGALTTTDTRTDLPRLTTIGKTLARIPLDPRLGRMLIEAERLGCLAHVMVVVAALSIQDVRERPLDYQAQADQLHARFKDPQSDFSSYLKLWAYINQRRDELSGNAFKKVMQQEFLHYMRIREWFDLVRQLKSIGEQVGWKSFERSDATDNDCIHQALLAGLLSHIGIKEGDFREFVGARNTRFMVFPGSSLAKKPPQFVMAGELVETSRLWARDVAAIDPRWVEPLAQNLLKHQYSEPHWSLKRGAAMVYQRSTLYGVPIVVDRLINLATIDAVGAREIFIREALINGQWTTHHSFFKNNMQKLEAVNTLEEKARRRDIVVTEDTLYEFYNDRLPQSVVSTRAFDHWWKKTRTQTPDLLDFDPDKLISDSAEEVNAERYPDSWYDNGVELELRYRFEPGHPDDGVTVNVPVPYLASLEESGFEWLVPGFIQELLTASLKTLPKNLRKKIVPAPNYANLIQPRISFRKGPLTQAITNALKDAGITGIEAEDFDLSALPDHLRITFAAIDKHGKVIDKDKNLACLKTRQKNKIRASALKIGKAVHQSAVTTWTSSTLGKIPEEVSTKVDGQLIKTYPALVIGEQGFSVEAKPTRAEADASMLTATLAMLMKASNINTQKMLNGLPLQQRVAVENYPHGSSNGLVQDVKAAVIRDLLIERGGPVRSPEEFDVLKKEITPKVPGLTRQAVVQLAPSINCYLKTRDEVAHWEGDAIDDISRQLDFLLPPFAVSHHGIRHLARLPRLCEAITIRLDSMSRDSYKDAELQLVINRLENALYAKANRGGIPKSKINDIAWKIQELRVSLFAQRLGTAEKVSERKIHKLIEAL
ncbi:ATP-dependent RNA helicase HrpA [Corynebacterium diphtheriae bv. gravis]|uniref:ATP-dependent RNA helicase HrpA n=1 Tax=Corynebacterium diphtheriae TaxID=1717 RepID=UPI00064CD281|nr:ATP-dependent RNA helicase HrpA [Corynebacterium diphtheriae]OWN07571.1 ATP-dependent RNA helicase HrpA [Corynebacterium belfantii]MBG9263191.1 ATP-dependent RNA helicase HrpA [Corynebacterium diphtheriae bv. gravis]OWM48759.1 ATP-dependent RNA helicase HrpA [Corynebacterium diphtheriae]OWM53094.1 ATP-dependent RNA helicase HrpA [Corynebacterium diphtheriae]OWM97135.1 ATP-dependent RNA helicase HrpA [Corynebacterium diphtheriae bv. mitis]